MRKWVAAFAVAVAVAFGGGLAVPGVADAAGKPSVKRSLMVDCEDQDVQPCIVLDDGRWRLVLSYAPYTAREVRTCTWWRKAPCFVHRMDTYEYRWRTSIGE